MPGNIPVMTRRVPARTLLGVHPAIILAVLDLVGLLVAGYLSIVELNGGVPTCGPFHGCEQVALSEYARIGGVPVAVFGVLLSIVLLSLALAWWKTNIYGLLLAHYALSLVGVIFDALLPVPAGLRHQGRVRLVRDLRDLAAAALPDRRSSSTYRQPKPGEEPIDESALT